MYLEAIINKIPVTKIQRFKFVFFILIIPFFMILAGCNNNLGKESSREPSMKETAVAKSRGFEAYQKGNWDKAISNLKKAADGNPSDINTHFQLGYAYERKNQTKEALNQYQEILSIDKYSADAHYNIGRIYMIQKNTDKAIEEYETSLRINSSCTGALADLAKAYTDKKLYEKALACYDKLLSAFKSDHLYLSRLHAAKGKIYLAMQNRNMANKEFYHAVKLDKNNIEATDALQK